MTTAAPYWHRYHDAATLARLAALVEVVRLPSTGVELHLDLYPQGDPAAPVVVLNHGGGGHAGLLAGLALALHDRGCTVVVPDQKGQGRSGGARGDFTLAEAVANIADAACFARRRFAGPLVLAGGSIGGGLTYYAAAALARAGAPPAAVVCLNLFDFGRPETALALTRVAALAKLPGLARLMGAGLGLLARAAPRLRLPYRPLARFPEMTDARDRARGFLEIWRHDPLVMTTVTARYMASLTATPPAIALEDNLLPVLVINQLRDRMVSPALTRACFARLGGPVAYAEIDWGHYSLLPGFNAAIADLAAAFLARAVTGST
ncbi:alpha/beta fold hydrolase [Zavarzinia compransoris]|nr:alpha/beta fold hydrolase [Zavarzinia compransoris]TDP43886.1 alpha-beta hydrolase superfamily lysophospholipase [Zavarzinia compransoris]